VACPSEAWAKEKSGCGAGNNKINQKIMKNSKKLIIVDFYGVLLRGSHQNTCHWLAKKYKMNYDKIN